MSWGDLMTKFPIYNQINHGHNIMRIFHVLPNFLFTTSETKLPHELSNDLRLRKLGQFRIMSDGGALVLTQEKKNFMEV